MSLVDREANPATKHRIPLDALVEVKFDRWLGDGACEVVHARLWVVAHRRDCDGTPLYLLAENPRAKWTQPTFAEWEDSTAFSPIGLMGMALHRPRGGFSEEQLTVVEVTDDLRYGHGALEVDGAPEAPADPVMALHMKPTTDDLTCFVCKYPSFPDRYPTTGHAVQYETTVRGTDPFGQSRQVTLGVHATCAGTAPDPARAPKEKP